MPKQSYKNIVVHGHGKNKKLKCYHCGEWKNKSILPHLRKEHPNTWQTWRRDWIQLYNSGQSPKQIMAKYEVNGEFLVSWTVIEKEIKRLAEEEKITLIAPTKKQLKTLNPTQEEFKLEETTVWDFPKRGSWATHKGDYRGNWAPQIPRNIILQYSKKGELILDPFVGGGTTLIEAKLLGRNAIGIDISPHAIQMTKQRLNELEKWKTKRSKQPNQDPKTKDWNSTTIQLKQADARNLNFIQNNSIDLVCTHPPYGHAIKYTINEKNDLSHIHKLKTFYDEIEQAAQEIKRILKPKHHCAILIGDIRKAGMILDVGFNVKEQFQKHLQLEEIIIKTQHRESLTHFWRDKNKLRYRIAHEYLFIFRKSE
jgi:DNA modification methylase